MTTAHHYQVKPGTSASVRSAPRRNAAHLKMLHSGDAWDGVEVPGGQASAMGKGASKTWVRRSDGACVWRGHLREVIV